MNTDRYEMKTRRYDLDWLRVLAFGLLILYHTGMFYVADWGWHVKSVHQSEWLQLPMLLSNQWRMPLIFLVSGLAAGREIFLGKAIDECWRWLVRYEVPRELGRQKTRRLRLPGEKGQNGFGLVHAAFAEAAAEDCFSTGLVNAVAKSEFAGRAGIARAIESPEHGAHSVGAA